MEFEKIVKILFLVLAGFACFTCYARADYNLPLFAFAYYLWDLDKPFQSQKIRLTYIFVYTWIVDFVWLVYWGPFWNSEVFDNSWAKGIQTFVLVLSSIAFVIKFATIVIVIYLDKNIKQSFTPEGAHGHLREIFAGGQQEVR